MIGISELFLIAILVVFLFKPNDYLSIIKQIKKTHHNIKNYFSNLKNEIFDDDMRAIEEDLMEMKDDFIRINGKNYIYGDDKKLHEVFSLNDEDIKKIDSKNRF